MAFESPRRVPRTLALLASLDPSRELAVCRELTKAHEEIVRGNAAELAARYADAPPRGEVVLVLGPRSVSADEGEPAGLDALRRLSTGRPPAQGGWSLGRAHGRERDGLYARSEADCVGALAGPRYSSQDGQTRPALRRPAADGVPSLAGIASS